MKLEGMNVLRLSSMSGLKLQKVWTGKYLNQRADWSMPDAINETSETKGVGLGAVLGSGHGA
jgi:hypothetical protein